MISDPTYNARMKFQNNWQGNEREKLFFKIAPMVDRDFLIVANFCEETNDPLFTKRLTLSLSEYVQPNAGKNIALLTEVNMAQTTVRYRHNVDCL